MTADPYVASGGAGVAGVLEPFTVTAWAYTGNETWIIGETYDVGLGHGDALWSLGAGGPDYLTAVFGDGEGGGGGGVPSLGPDPCEKLEAEMDRLINSTRSHGPSEYKGLRQRLHQMTRMKRDSDVFRGYAEQVESQKNGLRKRLRAWDENNCGEPPSGVRDMVDAPVLSFDDVQSMRQQQRMLQIGISAVGAYAGYRFIRLLPSLSPPMWWSLPFNVATP